MENDKLNELDKKVEELKSILEKKAIISNSKQDKDISEIINYDVWKELDKNIKKITIIRFIYIFLIIIIVWIWIYILTEKKSPEIVYKEIEKIVYTWSVCEENLYKEEKIKNLEQINSLNNELKLIKDSKLKIEKDFSLLKEENLLLSRNEININSTASWSIWNNDIYKELNTSKEEVEKKELQLVKTTNCSWKDTISLNINVRLLPWKDSERIYILYKWENIDIINCWTDVNEERWLKIRNANWIEWWISYIWLTNFKIE